MNLQVSNAQLFSAFILKNILTQLLVYQLMLIIKASVKD